MAIGKPLDLTNEYKQNVYGITLDLSGWDRATVQVLTPAAPIFVYGSNDSGAVQGSVSGSADTATNFVGILATNLTTNATALSMASSGLYKFDVNAQFVRLAGGGADVSKILIFNSKLG